MLIRKLENFLEGRIEGFFTKKFASSLRLDEIENRLSKEFYLKQRKVDNKLYVPDNYTIIVGEEDYQNLHCLDTYQQLYRFLLQSAIKKDFFFENRIALQMSMNMIKEPGSFSIQALYQTDGVVDAKMSQEQSSGFIEQNDHTLVFQKNSLLLENSNYSHVNFARLVVRSGVNIDTNLDIGEKRIHIGRRENNELFLPDKNCSRLHCYITYENNRHVLYDAGSLNGTRVNRHLCAEAWALRPGDKISIGNTVIVYEVD